MSVLGDAIRFRPQRLRRSDEPGLRIRLGEHLRRRRARREFITAFRAWTRSGARPAAPPLRRPQGAD